jgi:hypothetical protein
VPFSRIPYKRFIGFRVATPLLERAVRETYGLEMRDLFGDLDRSISTYRYAVSQIIPTLTDAAWRDKHDEIVKITPAIDRGAFVFSYPRTSFEQDYGRDYQRPGLFARFLGVLYRILPKWGRSSRSPSRRRHRKPPSSSPKAFVTRRRSSVPRSMT